MALMLKWHTKAQADFNDTLEYVFYKFGESTAEKVYSEVIETVNVLCAFPDIGIRYQNLFYHEKAVRVFHMKKSSIIYCYDDTTLFVLALRNQRSADTAVPEC